MSSAVRVLNDAPALYTQILNRFPGRISFCFAYGSGVKKQLGQSRENMIDLVYSVENSREWHEQNIKLHPKHYSVLRHFGPKIVAKIQENAGAKIYYNTLVPIDNSTMVKYGVVSNADLITDLLDWCDLYLAGRLHKPVEIVSREENDQLDTALQMNLQSAMHAALLLLPEDFTEYDLYYTISNLSYSGDFRMIFGENKNKVENIVKPQIAAFRRLYMPTVKLMKECLEYPVRQDGFDESGDDSPFLKCSQDAHPLTKLHHLNQLPKCPQKRLVRFWNRGKLQQDTEDVLRAIAFDLDCGRTVQECIKQIVWNSSVGQSLKGILTAGVFKSIVYSSKKILKMVK